MKTLDTLQKVYDFKKEDISGIKARIHEAVSWIPAHDKMKEILLANTENTGKMLRPVMMLMAAGDYDPGKRDELLWGAAAGEMLHTSSLLIDDVLDLADTRRGKPSVRALYGDAVAICAGNYLMTTSYTCLIDRGYNEIARDLLEATRSVLDGESIQDEYKWDTAIPEEMYMRSIEGKTAAVFSFCCRVASRITGHSAAVQNTMGEFGKTVGIMFQIRDDILDWTLDDRIQGKPAGEDFINGIYTLPVLFALRDVKYKTLIESFAAKRETLTAEELLKMKETVEVSGGIAYAMETMKRLSEKAHALLDSLPQDIYITAFRMLVKMFSLH